jgi:uncharacterized Rmd1/YagE family protein
MNKKNMLKVIGFVFLVSCQQNETFMEYNGYNDIIVDSPALLWSSSRENFQKKYPMVSEFGDNNIYFENNLDGKITSRFFDFLDNQLWRVGVCYGEYSDDELDLLKKDLQKKYGIYLIEDNGTIETWYLENNEHTQIVFNINKIEHNTIYGSYLNPPLRDLDRKKHVQNQ